VAGLVARVQREVNAAIEPAAEPASRDLWVVAPLAGDCEDFALTKREALRAAGLPAGALRLATAYTEAGEYHTVLTVLTERGTVVLDNRFAEVRLLADLPYRWVMVELPDRPFAWAYL
jgi:predicted transglutaminase-like cysteine proteinase